MAAAGYQARAKLARERHLHRLVERIDSLMLTLEELQAAGKDTVPHDVLEGAGEIVSEVSVVPSATPPPNATPIDVMDLLFGAQDEVFTLLHPERRPDL